MIGMILTWINSDLGSIEEVWWKMTDLQSRLQVGFWQFLIELSTFHQLANWFVTLQLRLERTHLHKVIYGRYLSCTCEQDGEDILRERLWWKWSQCSHKSESHLNINSEWNSDRGKCVSSIHPNFHTILHISSSQS